jgi:sulfatase modifying factor 1
MRIPAVLLVLILTGVSAMADAPVGMVRSAGGTFVPLYGDTKEPRTVATFLLDVEQVTNGDFLAFVRVHPEWGRTAVKRIFADTNYLRHWKSDLEPGAEVMGSPVTNVSWFAAMAYCRSLGKRLPSADEWEFAALADETRVDASTDDAFTQRILDWYGKPTPGVLPPVGLAAVNVYGVRGLHGVVWEWVRDFNNMMVTGESRGDNELERKLYCAGGALGATDVRNYAAFMRFAFRSSVKGNYCVANLGFRCAKDLE